ncbi:MAG: GGDEF domain-containing protein [Planctomycetes bacterium]|nr:GGDEF domain-containing protein [Planctomycetota bacterium]
MRDPRSSGDGVDTGLFSYAQILHLLKIEFSRARRYQYQLSCVLVEVDRLGTLGDMHGSQMRDQVEAAVADLLNRYSRSCDFVGRLGERFVIVLPHTDSKGARLLAQRLHDRIADLDVRADDRPLRISASVGVATQDGDESIFFDTVLKRAEEALGEVVSRGGDAVMMAG